MIKDTPKEKKANDEKYIYGKKRRENCVKTLIIEKEPAAEGSVK